MQFAVVPFVVAVKLFAFAVSDAICLIIHSINTSIISSINPFHFLQYLEQLNCNPLFPIILIGDSHKRYQRTHVNMNSQVHFNFVFKNANF